MNCACCVASAELGATTVTVAVVGGGLRLRGRSAACARSGGAVFAANAGRLVRCVLLPPLGLSTSRNRVRAVASPSALSFSAYLSVDVVSFEKLLRTIFSGGEEAYDLPSLLLLLTAVVLV